MAVIEVRHPLVQHKLGLLRQAGLSTKEFREITGELGTLLAYAATDDLPLDTVQVTGWAGPVDVPRLAGRAVTVVPVLRAGLGLLPGVLALLPAAKVGVVGLRRDEATLQAESYYENLTGRLDERVVLVLDPMLATGGTLVATLDRLKAQGARRIRALCLVAAPEGIAAVQARHADVDIVVASVDAALDARGYIVPGLGDAGDRIFGTRIHHD